MGRGSCVKGRRIVSFEPGLTQVIHDGIKEEIHRSVDLGRRDVRIFLFGCDEFTQRVSHVRGQHYACTTTSRAQFSWRFQGRSAALAKLSLEEPTISMTFWAMAASSHRTEVYRFTRAKVRSRGRSD